jgi:hypothetical protein
MYGEKEVAKIENTYRITPHYSAFDLEQLVKEYQGILLKYEKNEGR